MTSTVQIVLPCFVGAIASLATNETSVVLACDGCSPDGSVRHYHWQNNGAQPPVWDWYTGGGQIQYNSPVPNHDTGKCKIANGQCVPDPEDTCRAEIQLEITSSTLIRFVSDASGCVKWSDLTKDQKNLLARATVCEDAKQQDVFFGYNNTSCTTTAGAAGPEKLVIWAKCSACEGQ